MDTFLFILCKEKSYANRILQSSSRSLKKIFIDSLNIFHHSETFVENLGLGLLRFSDSRDGSNKPYFDVYETNQHIVIFWGNLYDQHKNWAKTILQCWLKGGCEAIKHLNGCFSVVIFDKKAVSVEFFGDFVGQRSLRYIAIQDAIIISPHDICLLATGTIELAIDYSSIASIATFGWSLDDLSLFQGIHTCKPFQVLNWKPDGIKERDYNFLQYTELIEASNHKDVIRKNELILDEMSHFTSQIIAYSEKILVELSAGFDSRIVLAILLSCTNSSNLSTFSCGPINSLDVRVAREISNRLNISFFSKQETHHTTTTAISDVKHTALATNGNSTALYIVTNDPITSCNKPPLSFCGDGGEIFRFRDSYYPKSFFGIKESLNRKKALDMLLSKNRNSYINWSDPSVLQKLNIKLTKILDDLLEKTDDYTTALDLFFLWQRFAIWNGKLARDSNYFNRISPFFSRKAIQLVYSLPRPVGQYTQFHADVIRSNMNECYSILINEKVYLPSKYGHFPVLSDFIELKNKAMIKYRKKLYSCQRKDSENVNPRDFQASRSYWFNNLLGHKFSDFLLSKSSACSALFENDYLDAIVSQQLSGNPIYSELLGNLFTVEYFIRLCKAAAAKN